MPWNKTNQTLLGLFLFHIFFNGLALCIPVIVLYWQSHGISLTGVMILQSFFAVILVILEVPSGYIADIWGRKRAMVSSSIALTVASLLLCLSTTFWQFMVAEIGFALALSLLSGADSALLYDTLKAENRTGEYEKIWGRLQSISLVATALMTSVAGVLYQVHMRLPFVLGTIWIALSMGGALMLKEPERGISRPEGNYFKDLWYAVKPFVRDNGDYRELLLWYAIVFTLCQTVFWFYQPYFVTCGIAIPWFGLLFTVFNLTAAAASHFAAHLTRWTLRFPVGAFPLLLLLISYLVMGHWASPVAISAILLHQVVRGWFTVAVSARLNRLVASAYRATLLSFCSMGGRLVYAAFLPVTGWMADTLSLLPALKYLGIITIVVFLIRLLLPRKKKNGWGLKKQEAR